MHFAISIINVQLYYTLLLFVTSCACGFLDSWHMASQKKWLQFQNQECMLQRISMATSSYDKPFLSSKGSRCNI